jgi:hypothetical protein
MNGVIVVSVSPSSAAPAPAATPPLSLQRHATACLQIKVLFLNAPASVEAEHCFGTESRETVRRRVVFARSHVGID